MRNLITNRQSILHCAYFLVASVAVLGTFLPENAKAQLGGVIDDKWTGTASANWSDIGNWSLSSPPGGTDTIRFDSTSTGNLSTNQDIDNLSISGIVNTSTGGVGPNIGGTPTQVSITGKPITIGATGIINGTGTPADAYGYTGPAQVNVTVDVDLILSADQRWKAGGPGTNTAGRDQAIVIGASPNSHTVTLNGFKPILSPISNANDMIIVNSTIVDGSAASKIGISKFTAAGFDTGNINTLTRVRISGNNTYSGGTDILGGRQIIQIGSSSVKSGSTIVSGPFGTGPINTKNDNFTGVNNQTPYFQAYGADQTVDNDINCDTQCTINIVGSTGTQNEDTGVHMLTFAGTLTVPASVTIAQNNQLTGHGIGPGDVVFNGNILLGGLNGTITTGQVGTAPAAGVSVGKQVYNGNILYTGSGGSYSLAIANGTAAVPTIVQLSGQNTFANTTLSAAGASSPAADANLGIGSSSILDGGGNIVSGPLGLGTFTVSGATATGSSIEALGGARTLANIVNISTVQSTMVVQGSNDLTLTGTVTGGGNLTKNGSGKLILNGATNNYLGATTVNSGTLLVNGDSSAATGAVTVASGSVLGGTGTIGGSIMNSGTLAPGASVGTLSVIGNVIDSANSHWAIELSGTSADKLAVTGDIDLSAVDSLDITGSGSGTSWLIGTYTGTLLGTFDTVTSGYSVTYTGGNITLNFTGPPALPGDFNSDGKVDAGDYVTWRKNNGTNNALANDNGLGVPVGTAHYSLWRANFGNPPGAGSGEGLGAGSAVPEPGTFSLLYCLVGAILLVARGFGRKRK
jgi:fibronectin-binding autotransporter adhesin